MTHNLANYLKYLCIALVAACIVTGGPSYAAFSGELAVLNDLGLSVGAVGEGDGKCPEAVRSGGGTCDDAIAALCKGDPDCQGKDDVTCKGKGGNTRHCKCGTDGKTSDCWTTKGSTTVGALGDAVGGLDLY
ncbi:MAG: hypothetical protein HS102_05540 [Planctomycetia bacterium]|nr:hypothetical protein [Planctomycetia bacterium]